MNRHDRRGHQAAESKVRPAAPPQVTRHDPPLRGVRLLVAVPCYGGIHPAWVLSLAKGIAVFAGAGVEHNLLLKSEAEIVSLRNDLATQCLTGGATHLLFTDADQSWNPDDVVRWLRANLPVVGAPYAKKEHPTVLTCTAKDPRETCARGGGAFVRASRLGTGLVLISREALESLAVSVTRYVAEDGGSRLDFFGTLYPTLPSGLTGRLSEDVSFATRLDRAGIPMWIDPEAVSVHYDGRGSAYEVTDAQRADLRGTSL